MKQNYRMTKNELKAILITEMERCLFLKKNKEVKKIETTLNAMKRIPEQATLKVEGVRGNNENRVMVNIGTVFEELVKHYYKRYLDLYKSANGKADLKQGFVDIEIKTSLSNARNTALTEEKSLILVNHLGAYRVKKEMTLQLPMDSQGRFYENLDYSTFKGARLIKSLSKKLGLR